MAGFSYMPLHRKLLIGTLVLVLVPMLACAILTNRIARTAMEWSHAQHARSLAGTAAIAISRQMEAADLGANPGMEPGGRVELDDSLVVLERNPGLAFVIVEDWQGRVLYERTVDRRARTDFESWVKAGGEELDSHAIHPDSRLDLVVWREPVWTASGSAEADRASGTLLLGLRDREMGAVLEDFQDTLLLSVAVICGLSLPVVYWAVRRWVHPLRELVAASGRLGAGEVPAAVHAATDDEVGQLTAAFDRMARDLYAVRLRLQRSNDALEGKVAARTVELERARRRLESEIRDKDEFLRAASHDLIAPLRNIGGMASLLLEAHYDELDEEIRTKLERINADVEMQFDLIDDLVSISQLRTQPSRQERVNLGELFEDLRHRLEYDLERHGIALELPAFLPEVVADKNRLQRVFLNLIDNAIKYMGDSSQRKITVGFEQQDEQMHFTVTDTGSGIRPDDQSRIFQVFARGRSHRAKDIPGRGIGLAGVKAIIECYGGRIWVNSEPGRGSAFHLTFDCELMKSNPPTGAGDELAQGGWVRAAS